jgi:hypothetical protein
MPVLRFERNADGTIAMNSMTGAARSRVTLARAPSSPSLANLNLVGVAQYIAPSVPRPMRRPRFALLWDRPGTTPLESNGAALSFRAAYATFFVVQAGAPPAEVQGRAYGVPTALAFLFVYDDVNDNGTYDLATDESRGFGPLTIAWRGEGTPSATFDSSPFAGLDIPALQGCLPRRSLATRTCRATVSAARSTARSAALRPRRPCSRSPAVAGRPTRSGADSTRSRERWQAWRWACWR